VFVHVVEVVVPSWQCHAEPLHEAEYPLGHVGSDDAGGDTQFVGAVAHWTCCHVPPTVDTKQPVWPVVLAGIKVAFAIL